MVFGRDGFTYPYHNYLGPGNTIYKDDEADLDAYIHDLEYELATSDKDTRDADREAYNNFINYYKRYHTFAEFTGIVGLSLKYDFESIFGVVYPFNMSSDTAFPQLIYATREKHISSEWLRIKDTSDKGGFWDYKDLKNNALIVKQIYESYRTKVYHYQQLKRDFDAQRGVNSRPSTTNNIDELSVKRPRPSEYNEPENKTILFQCSHTPSLQEFRNR